MAQLKNLTISDTGYLSTAVGTTAQRPATSTVSVSLASGLSIAQDGLQLYIPYPSPWQVYQNLPDVLKGLRCTISINDSDSATFTIGQPTRVYLLRYSTWSSVDLTGYTLFTSGNFLSGYGTIDVYYRDYTSSGTYAMDNYSAMYFFSPIAGGDRTAVGAMRYNSTTYETEVWDGNQWLSLSGNVGITSTGGTTSGAVTAGGGYKIHTFTSSGSFVPTYSGTVEVLVIGGGGCGAGLSGGGGGGGFVYNNSYKVVGGQTYAVTVGNGGPGPASHSPGSGALSGQGQNSQFGPPQSGLIATGGGHGGYWTGAAANGGSGGGGPGYNYSNGQRPGGEGIKGQGHPGGYGHHGSGPAQGLSPQPGICVYGGGGGGGAGEKGQDRFSWRADAKGGDGMASSITGATRYYSGGGGGGVHAPSGNYGRDFNSGGLGGGGISYSAGPQAAHDGIANSGGGGGGAYHPDAYRSGNGGSGIVVVRYRT